jgi:Predicted solute binding protein
MNLIACLVLPPSVVSGPTGTIITRLLEQRKEGDNRPDYALKGKTVAVYLESLYHNYLDDSPNVSRARTARQEWFKTTQSNYQNMKLALQAVGKGIYYDFTKFSPTAMPADFVGKGKKLAEGEVLKTTSHTFRGSSRLNKALAELRKTLQVGDEVIEEDGTTIRLDSTDIEDIRALTPRGLKLLELITDKGPATTATTQTTAATTTPAATQTAAATTTTGTTPAKPPARTNVATQAPIQVRLTRAAVRALREAMNAEEEKRRKRVARALAQLAI